MKPRSAVSLVLCLSLSWPALAPAQAPLPAVPGKDWERIEKPKAVGYSAESRFCTKMGIRGSAWKALRGTEFLPFFAPKA